MSNRGRPKTELVLSDEEREVLGRWAKRPKSSQGLVVRSRIVLACAGGASNRDVAVELSVSRVTVGKWRARFVEKRLDGLVDEPRPGAPRTIGDDAVERVVVATLEEAPPDSTHWSTRGLAKRLGMSQSSIGNIWRAFGLKPWAVDEFKISNDPMFIEKVRDLVGLYQFPPDAAAVFCVDEKTQVQALDRTAPILPLLPGTPQRRSHDYKRNGTSDLYAALNVATGQVLTQMTAQHRAVEFRKFLNLINRNVPEELDVHIILDNLSVHKTPEIHRWLIRHPRFKLHFTPTYSSWMNLVERWFAELTMKCLRRGTHTSVAHLRQSMQEWIDNWNIDPKPYVWHKTADEIIESLGQYCQRIINSGH